MHTPLALSIVLATAVLWLLANPGQVFACKCVQPGTPTEELEKFSAVFAGEVVSIQHSYDPNASSASREDRTTVGFRVSTVWKGTVHEEMYITTPPTGGSCGFTFSDGNEYIVYAYAPMQKAAIQSAYAAGPPSSVKRRPTSTLSGRGKLLESGRVGQHLKNGRR